MQVNSLHRQAIATPAPNLEIDARADDGTIEAVHPTSAHGWVLATQWHPEYWVKSDDTLARIFAAFGKAMRECQQQRAG